MVESRRHLDGGLWGISIPLPIEHRACADNSHGAELRGRCLEQGCWSTIRVKNMPPKTPYDHISAQLPAMRLIAKAVGLFSPRVRESWRQVESQLAAV